MASHLETETSSLQHPASDGEGNVPQQTEILPADTVLIVGGGPVGLNLATVLAYYGVKSVVLERNKTTTKWPKMDLTNARSMELFRKLGLADAFRSQGVASHIPCPVLISTGLSKHKAITKWQLPSVDQCRIRTASINDGTRPLEPYQRLSQAVFEKWLKGLCDSNPLIDLRFGCKVESIEELPDGVKMNAVYMKDGKRTTILSRYVAGCDGASSKVRRGLNIPLDGGPTPGYMLLIHFKSRDLTRIHRQGQFWHIFFVGKAGLGGAIIAQNEIDTWTIHLPLQLHQDPDTISSQDAVYTVLGGLHGKYPIKIDEILVRSTYRPSIAITRTYCGTHGRVFLAGDSAHQNIPTGGYGMNMGISDAFDLGWKLAAVINGYSGSALLDSYEKERRPVALLCIERSGVHMAVHMDTAKIVGEKALSIDDETQEGQQLRQAIHEHYQAHDGENQDLGIEMGYRYKSGITVPDGSEEPEYSPSRYTPTTWPGSRAPHVYLKDGTSIFDHYGKFFTLIEFSDDKDLGADLIIKAATELWVPVEHAILDEENHALKIWERRLVLVRPDGHVAWRANGIQSIDEAKDIIRTVAGLKSSDSYTTKEATENSDTAAKPQTFSSTIGVYTQQSEFKLERMGDFQT